MSSPGRGSGVRHQLRDLRLPSSWTRTQTKRATKRRAAQVLASMNIAQAREQGVYQCACLFVGCASIDRAGSPAANPLAKRGPLLGSLKADEEISAPRPVR